ncbi:MAG: HlyD family efflux transporter periplasmic adaptor subunit [Fuerstiella sp.]
MTSASTDAPPAAAKSPEQADPLEKARQIMVSLRSDLHVSRQLHHQAAHYVIHDPVSFRTHRLTTEQYRLLTSIDASKSLGDNFQDLVLQGEFENEDEQAYFEIVSQFSRLSLIVMPNANGAQLYEQYTKVTANKRKSRFLGALFLQIPLVNPDRFLTKTMHLASWLFTKAFFITWIGGMLAAGFVLIQRRADLLEPLNGILALQNLPYVWISFVGLKVWHELGHGYACKKFGGRVPEMGTILIAGTPAAYVDATAAWSFPESWKRLTVMCGGMFFESLIFIPGVFIWAFSTSSLWQSFAYQLAVTASLVTILFNANPLMRFDGYFILSELVGIQNLRPRADATIKRFLVRTCLGLKPPPTQDSASTRTMLVLYGIAARIYRFTLVISIAVVVALRFPLVGLLLAAFHVVTSLGLGLIKMVAYLLKSKETEPVRGRARLVALALVVGLPVLACIVPVPFGVVREGLIATSTEHFVNVDAAGEFTEALVESGQTVEMGTPLINLKNERLVEQLELLVAEQKAAQRQWEILQQEDPIRAAQQLPAVTELNKQIANLQEQVDRLIVTSPGKGQVLRMISTDQQGRFLQPGEQVAVVVAGATILRAWLNEDQLGSIEREVGAEVSFRMSGESLTTYKGKITAIETAAESTFQETALSQMAGGEILVDTTTGRPLEPVFRIDIAPIGDSIPVTQHGGRVSIKLDRRYQSVASWVTRKCVRFIQKLLVT